ncbi:hypothetical protein BDZ97DRAFT_1667579, partial [Flammula alnicola]
RYNITAHSAWASLIPENRGIMPVGQEGKKMQVALYQQLECINNLRISMLHLYNVATAEPHIPPDFAKSEMCFGVLRQLLLCAADPTMEHTTPEYHADGTVDEKSTIHGLEDTHRCRDWRQVWDLANDK